MPDETQVKARGYVMEEYLASGTASRIESPGDSSSSEGDANGRWSTHQMGAEPFVTRFVVIRPQTREDFNGVVVLNWQNVSGGMDYGIPSGREIWRGYAWVGVTTQRAAMTGIAPVFIDGEWTTGPGMGLADWDRERYGALRHPGDAYSYSMFTAVARALGPDRRTEPVDPLAGLQVATLVATGPSQSAVRLASYINGAHQHELAFDAFMPVVHWGQAILPGENLQRIIITPQADIVGGCQIRDDQRVPILVVNSETEAWSMYPVRQPDSATYRFWEIAGGCHVGDPQAAAALEAILERDGIPGPAASTSGPPPNSLDWSYVEDAALRSLVAWTRGHGAPATFPTIEMEYGDPLKSITRDELGLAVGGLRLPEVDVPVAVQAGSNGTADLALKLSGERRPFPAELLRTLYGSAAEYERRYNLAADEAAGAGAVLRDDLDELKGRGRELARRAGLR
jgi:hypothetical protein